MKIRDGSTPWLAYNRVFMCSGIKRNVVICEKGKKGRKITKRLQGPVSLLLVLDEKHKRYPRGSAVQQAGARWHLKGWRIDSGRAGKVAKLLNYSMNERSRQIVVGTTFSPPHHWVTQEADPMRATFPEVSAHNLQTSDVYWLNITVWGAFPSHRRCTRTKSTRAVRMYIYIVRGIDPWVS